MEPCVPLLRLDHFMGNEVTFIFTCIGLGIVPISAYFVMIKNFLYSLFSTYRIIMKNCIHLYTMCLMWIIILDIFDLIYFVDIVVKYTCFSGYS